jgi:hypothetical protein
MKTVSKLKISQVAPRKISVLLCQVLAATAVFSMFARVWSLNSQFNKSAPDKIVVSLNESATQPGKQNMETTEMTDTLKSINTTPHLCRSKVKQTALEIAAAIRPANKFSRVGMSFVERIEAKVRAAIREEVRIHPSKGKTLL